MCNNSNEDFQVALEHSKMFHEAPDRERKLVDSLNEQRKTGKFCDILLKVGDYEILAHRSILSIAIPKLFEDDNRNNKKLSDNFVVELKGLDPRAVEKLVDYSYTARIEVPVNEVGNVFVAAKSLGLTDVEKAALRFIEESLLPHNWLSVRSFAQRNNCGQLLSATDKFLSENFERLCHGKEFMSLPRLQIELTGRHGHAKEELEGEDMCKTVISWAKKQLQEGDCTLSQLLEHTYIMYLTPDKELKECAAEDLADENKFVATEAQKVYIRQKSHEQAKMEKLNTRRMENSESIVIVENTKNKKKRPLSMTDKDLHLIAACQSMDSDCVGVASLGDEIVALSVHQQLSSSSLSISSDSSASEDWVLITPMSRGRCGAGAAASGGKLYAVGGYDRGDCLDLVECYDPLTNEWMQVKSLGCRRGRFELVVLDGKIYAVGGSDGHLDLKSVECYDPDTNIWTNIAPMKQCRSSLGVAIADDLLYAVGGQWENKNLGTAEVYDLVEKRWSKIPTMNVDRGNLCLAALNGKLYAIGGFNGWSCYSSVECYDPREGIWSFVKPMTVPRRGAGAVVFNGMIYVIGGSDGTAFLNSVECYNPETNEWTLLASMDTARQNVGVTVVGEHIYAVGGFSGSAFLKTVEYYDAKANKWNSFVSSQ